MHRFDSHKKKKDTESEFRVSLRRFAVESVGKLLEAYTVARHYQSETIPTDEEMDELTTKAREDCEACAQKSIGGSLFPDGTHCRKFAVMTEMVFERCLEIIREAKNEVGRD